MESVVAVRSVRSMDIFDWLSATCKAFCLVATDMLRKRAKSPIVGTPDCDFYSLFRFERHKKNHIMDCSECGTYMKLHGCPLDLTLGYYPHRHPVSISETNIRFETLASATDTLARLLFAPPQLPEAVRLVDTIEAARAFQIAVSVVLYGGDTDTSAACQGKMYNFWVDGGWHASDWEDDEDISVCPVAFFVGLFFDPLWIETNFAWDEEDWPVDDGHGIQWSPGVLRKLASEEPWEMLGLIVKFPNIDWCETGCLGLSFAYQWWVAKKTTKKTTPGPSLASVFRPPSLHHLPSFKVSPWTITSH
jgi:hypothetical protein